MTGSTGNTDIFVAQVSADTGKEPFVRQTGTVDDDKLALRGGLTTDKDGNAIAGNTSGSLYRGKAGFEAPSAYVFFYNDWSRPW
jgi:hypothetical protein